MRDLKRILLLSLAYMLLFTVCLAAPTGSYANGPIGLTVSDPLAKGEQKGDGTTINTVLTVPTVTYGDNKEMGTLRITGKEWLAMPLAPGARIMVTMPPGTCYMQTPTALNYQKYVQWPEYVNGKKNKIQTKPGEQTPGIKFVAGTPRSLTVEIGYIDPENEIMVIEFVFNQDNYSKARVSPLLDLAKEYEDKQSEKVTRLEFFRSVADITLLFPSSSLDYVRDKTPLTEWFTDVDQADSYDYFMIKPLVTAGLIGSKQGLLRPDDFITREEALDLISKLLQTPEAAAALDTTLPDWAVELVAKDENSVPAHDNTTVPSEEQFVNKGEALALLQCTLESYAN